MFQFTRGTSCSRLSCEQLIANKCDQSARCLIMDLEFGVWCPLKLCRLWFGLVLPVSEARSSENNPFFSRRVVLSAREKHFNMTDDLSRLGESAAGDRVSGHLPVSRVDPVPGPPPLPPLPHQHLDLQMAYCSHHAGSCE